ncbi:MAG TPA: hypothetical protein VGS19_04885 [Streptosporangiaceae bacterium]|nr:hypothetical protein [Streptosporangiaceae bacterium]
MTAQDARTGSACNAEARAKGAAGGRSRPVLAAALLALVAIAWAAVPLRSSGVPAFAASVLFAAAELPRLLTIRRRPGEEAPPSRRLARLLRRAARLYLAAPWGEAMTVSVLLLEAAGDAGAWHTAVLGVALLAFLFAVHLTETGDRPGALRMAAPVLAAGLGLLVLAAGATALPLPAAGTGSELLRVVAVFAAVAVGALALPTGSR